MFVWIIQRELTHYRIPFFLALANKVPLRVTYGRTDSEATAVRAREHDIFIQAGSWFPSKRNPYVAVVNTLATLWRARGAVVIHELSLSFPNVYIAALLARLFRFHLVWWSHGYNRFDKEGKSRVKVWLRIVLHKLADAAITYSQGGKEFLVKYGIKEEKVFLAWNAIEPLNGSISVEQQRREGKQGFEAVFLGRLIEEKKPLVVVRAFVEFQKKHAQSVLHIIGSGPEEQRLQEYIREHTSEAVRFHGEITEPVSLASILASCDLMLNAGYLGLNVVHAISFGLPIISPGDGVGGVHHSPEVEYIAGTPAYIAIGSVSEEAIYDALTRLTDNPARLAEARRAAIKCSESVSLDRMVEGFLDCLRYLTVELDMDTRDSLDRE